MKKQRAFTLTIGIIVGALFIIFLLSSCSEEAYNPALTKSFSLQSITNDGTYDIKVALPDGYSSNEKYSSIYVLDGKENFDFVANQCQKISRQNGTQNVLVISIGYGQDRSIDYTPTKVSSVTGGGGQFLAFIENQLIPRIEQDFNVDTTRSSRVILGHSYGGLFGAFALAVDNKLFGNYLLLSPSIWFDNEVVMQLEKVNRALISNKKQLVFMGIGEMENAGRMQAPFEAFYQILHDNYPNAKISKHREKNLDHVGSKNPNMIMGLNYYFNNR